MIGLEDVETRYLTIHLEGALYSSNKRNFPQDIADMSQSVMVIAFDCRKGRYFRKKPVCGRDCSAGAKVLLKCRRDHQDDAAKASS